MTSTSHRPFWGGGKAHLNMTDLPVRQFLFACNFALTASPSYFLLLLVHTFSSSSGKFTIHCIVLHLWLFQLCSSNSNQQPGSLSRMGGILADGSWWNRGLGWNVLYRIQRIIFTISYLLNQPTTASSSSFNFSKVFALHFHLDVTFVTIL